MLTETEGRMMSKKKRRKKKRTVQLEDGAQDWQVKCDNCHQLPTVHPLRLCGPCCFGEADTSGGNW